MPTTPPEDDSSTSQPQQSPQKPRQNAGQIPADTISEFDQVRIDENLPDTDTEAVQIYQQAIAYQTAESNNNNKHTKNQQQQQQPVSISKQILQLTIIPAAIVAGVMGVWILFITLWGHTQSLDSILTTLESAPVIMSSSNNNNGSASTSTLADIARRPGYQERQRAALNLVAMLEGSEELSAEEKNNTSQRLVRLAELHMGHDEQNGMFIMGALAILSDPQTIPVFKTWLQSEHEPDRYAAVVALNKWRGNPARDLIPLIEPLTDCLESPDLRTKTLAALLLAATAQPNNQTVTNALAKVLDDPNPANRDAVWNAACALAVLGDDRGIPIVLSLLDRQWLASLPLDPAQPTEKRLTESQQNKIITTVLNVAVGYNSTENKHFVRIKNAAVWTLISQIAENDESDLVKTVAKKVLDVSQSG